VGIHTNKNTVPGDPQSPFVTSGLRLGTPALTTRGMGEEEMRRVAGLIDAVLQDPESEPSRRVIAQVRDLAAGFPLYATAPAGR
jgi:glycine hydroxymethyltransferase